MNSRFWSGKRVSGATRKLADFETGPGRRSRTVSRCCHAVVQMTTHGGGLPGERQSERLRSRRKGHKIWNR